jgi:transposase
MTVYSAIDLHSNNSVVVVLDEQDRVLAQRRVSNRLSEILTLLSPYRSQLHAVAVESTYNWYWLVDGLMDAGYRVVLVNTAAVKSYEGLKYSNDQHDARWLAHLMRLKLLPQGYLYPREQRAVRDLLRKRMQLVQCRTQQVLAAQNLMARNLGATPNAASVKRMQDADIAAAALLPAQRLAVASNVAVVRCLQEQIEHIEREALSATLASAAAKNYRALQDIDGIGKVLGLTIALETGEIERFARVGRFASYCRCVGSRRISNDKLKGRGNTKNGNAYLAWAFIEAANFAIRYNPAVKRYYERKLKRSHRLVALKAVAHKLARACYFVMRDGVAFDVQRAFGVSA